jgi:hypothetical protein
MVSSGQIPELKDAPALWIVFSGALLLLGLNKQLDLQTLGLKLLRQVAQAQGWFPHRRLAQGIFVVMAVAGSAAVLWRLRGKLQAFRQYHSLAFWGGVFLGSYVMLRLALINHADQLLSFKNGDIKGLALLELTGIGCIIVASLQK